MDAGILFNNLVLPRLLLYLAPITYIVLRRVHPIFLRNPSLYPTSAAFCMVRVKRMLEREFALPRSMFFGE